MASSAPDHEVTVLLRQWRNGDREAHDRLLALVYHELRRVARARLRADTPHHTLQPTALVHEAYLRLMGTNAAAPQNRAHLFALAARAMRQVLVDYARARASRKRGGDVLSPLWTASLEVKDESGGDLIDLIEMDRALTALATESESKAQLIEMRFFGGMTAEEIAETLAVSVHVVRHELRFAQAWLRRYLAR